MDLQFQVAENGVAAIVWDGQSHGWDFVPDSGGWSWPILSPGGRRPGKDTAPLTDAHKGAITDGLTKAASMIGVGHEVFKGLMRVAQPGRAPESAQTPRQPRTPAQPAQQPHSAPQQPPADPGTRGSAAVPATGRPSARLMPEPGSAMGAVATAQRAPKLMPEPSCATAQNEKQLAI